MKSLGHWTAHVALIVMAAAAGSAGARPVLYTLRTVADGKLGGHVFAEALVTIRLKSDTKDVQAAPSANGGFLFTNREGVATVSIEENGTTRLARFAPGEIFVQYDSGNGLAGFGSAISYSYPIALDCSEYAFPTTSTYTQDCLQTGNYDDGTISALQLPAQGWSPALLALPKSLVKDTVLTGKAHTCATVYTFDSSGYLLTCAAPAPRGLQTDRGGFFLQDQIGSTAQPVGPFSWQGWDLANVGVLQVEVLPEDEDQ